MEQAKVNQAAVDMLYTTGYNAILFYEEYSLETRIVSMKYVGRKNGAIMVEILCTCGNTKIVTRPNVLAGKTRSCGCLRSEAVVELHERNITHGDSYSPEYYTWQAMKARCTNKQHPNYADYGGRGITVCDRWLNSYVNFKEDMGERPVTSCTLERVNNNLGYCKDNCVWADWITQANNRRGNKHADQK